VDAAIKSMLQDTVLIAPYVGQDAYGAPTYGPAVPTLARIERHFMTQLTTTGAQLVEETVLWVDADAVIDERSKLTLPDGRTVPIEGLKPVQDENGVLDHFHVFL
jgi:hypothetical protein